MESILWRRLDTPGHDACRLEKGAGHWTLDGTAVFQVENGPASLAYRVTCDAAWRTREGSIRGWFAGRSIEIAIERSAKGEWMLNGSLVPDLEACVDLDLGFTPATNLSQLRRIALAPGRSADVPVAWFDIPTFSLALLPQRYERRTEKTYWYEAPSFGYEGLLEVDATGFVTRYPGLWEAER